nr:hypothetical protein CFP56_07974 [Quercus suber]
MDQFDMDAAIRTVSLPITACVKHHRSPAFRPLVRDVPTEPSRVVQPAGLRGTLTREAISWRHIARFPLGGPATCAHAPELPCIHRQFPGEMHLEPVRSQSPTLCRTAISIAVHRYGTVQYSTSICEHRNGAMSEAESAVVTEKLLHSGNPIFHGMAGPGHHRVHDDNQSSTTIPMLDTVEEIWPQASCQADKVAVQFFSQPGSFDVLRCRPETTTDLLLAVTAHLRTKCGEAADLLKLHRWCCWQPREMHVSAYTFTVCLETGEQIGLQRLCACCAALHTRKHEHLSFPLAYPRASGACRSCQMRSEARNKSIEPRP